jgi:hypothetical protein
MILETHKKYYIEHLKEVGAKPELAEAIVELHIESGEQLATKHDLKDAKSELKGDINRLDSKIDNIASGLRSDIRDLIKDISWLKTISIANFTLLLGGIITMLFSK